MVFPALPHDVHDWDSVQVPVLVDDEFQGRRRKLIYWAHRNAFYYVLDRETGKFLLGTPFATQTWAKGLDDRVGPSGCPTSTLRQRGPMSGRECRAQPTGSLPVTAL